MAEPNEVGNEEQVIDNQQQTQEPVAPKRPNLRVAGNTAIKTTVKATRKILEIFAAMPLPLKIAIIAIIALIIIVVVILQAEASESTDTFIDSASKVIEENSDEISDEAKESYEKYGSFLKFPIATLLKMYDGFSEGDTFAGHEIRGNYNYICGTNEIDTSKSNNDGTSENANNGAGSQDMEALCKKAVEMAKKGGVTYGSNGRQLVTTVQELDSLKKTDCSGFVYSIYKAIIGINVDSQTEDIKAKGSSKYSENGWTAELHEIGDGSEDVEYGQNWGELKPGDILYRYNHVGIYVGNYGEKNHVDQGGPSAGPQNKNYESKATKYTHYIRYTKSS